MTIAIETTLYHNESLLRAMGGSPEGWEYTGVVTDAGKIGSHCACGHHIRYEYWWAHRDGRQLKTGSVCVEHLPFVDPSVVAAMRADLNAMIAKRKEDVKKAKLASETEAVQSRLSELDAMADERWGREVKAHEKTRGWVPADVYAVRRLWHDWRDQRRWALSAKTAKGQMRRLDGLTCFFPDRG